MKTTVKKNDTQSDIALNILANLGNSSAVEFPYTNKREYLHNFDPETER